MALLALAPVAALTCSRTADSRGDSALHVLSLSTTTSGSSACLRPASTLATHTADDECTPLLPDNKLALSLLREGRATLRTHPTRPHDVARPSARKLYYCTVLYCTVLY